MVNLIDCWKCRYFEYNSDGYVHCLGKNRPMVLPEGCRMLGGHLWKGTKKLYFDEEGAPLYRKVTIPDCPAPKLL